MRPPQAQLQLQLEQMDPPVPLSLQGLAENITSPLAPVNSADSCFPESVAAVRLISSLAPSSKCGMRPNNPPPPSPPPPPPPSPGPPNGLATAWSPLPSRHRPVRLLLRLPASAVLSAAAVQACV